MLDLSLTTRGCVVVPVVLLVGLLVVFAVASDRNEPRIFSREEGCAGGGIAYWLHATLWFLEFKTLTSFRDDDVGRHVSRITYHEPLRVRYVITWLDLAGAASQPRKSLIHT